MTFDPEKLKQIVEGALLAAGKPLTAAKIQELFEESETEPRPGKDEIEAAIEDIQAETRGRGFELVKVASGYRMQVKQDLAPWVSRLWEEKPARYSRALLETLALVAYRQPITRGEIEDIRGVAVSTNIMRTLLERDWVRVVGHREVPGKPAMYATTRTFLDYFNLSSLDELPTLAEIRDLENISAELNFSAGEGESGAEAAAEGEQPAPVELELAAAEETAGEESVDPAPGEEPGEAEASAEVTEVAAEAEAEGQDERELPSNVIELPTS